MGKKIALLIGVSKYKNESDLPPSERDLELISSIVAGAGKYDDWITLDDSPESCEAKEKISSFIRKHQKQDIDEVFFYYTGHGARHLDDFLYLFSDYSNSKIEQTSLRNSEFDSMLKSLNPQMTIKIVDACQAGTEYIKSDQDLQAIFEKSSSESFNKTYFLFSSSNSESSVALQDYSVFTKSFAKSLLGFEGRDIRYRDIMAYISDDSSVKKHQTPLFILQADNTEIFCNVSSDLADSLRIKIEPLSDNSDEGKSVGSEMQTETDSEQSFEDKLIQEIKKKNKEYCTEEEAQSSLSQFIENIKSYEWSDLLSQLFEIEIEPRQDYSHVSGLVNVAKWINDSDEPYFVRLTYDKQGYQAKERVEIEDVPGRSSLVLFGTKKRVEYKPVTRYRDVISGIQLTAPAPCSSVIINLSPKEEVLPWLKIFIVYVFSKSKLTIFFKHEIEKELSWNNRSVQNRNQWKTVNCGLKDTNSIQTTVESSLNSFEKSIIDGFSSDFKVE